MFEVCAASTHFAAEPRALSRTHAPQLISACSSSPPAGTRRESLAVARNVALARKRASVRADTCASGAG